VAREHRRHVGRVADVAQRHREELSRDQP
jgi:hypothetical protein